MEMETLYSSGKSITALLRSNGIGLKKRWGQNFLVNKDYREKIIEAVHPGKNDKLWEIGPGLGSLTVLLSGKCKELVAFELDRGLLRILEALSPEWENRENLRFVQGDFCVTWNTEEAKNGPPRKIVGNLPYSSGSAMIVDLIKSGIAVEKMVFMVQKEVGERMTALPGSKTYSAFSLFCRYAYHPRRLFTVPPQAFFPKPEVESAVIELTPHGLYNEMRDPKIFFSSVNGMFHSRRKTVRNSLRGFPGLAGFSPDAIDRALAAAGIDPNKRGETVTPEEAVRFASALEKQIPSRED